MVNFFRRSAAAAGHRGALLAGPRGYPEPIGAAGGRQPLAAGNCFPGETGLLGLQRFQGAPNGSSICRNDLAFYMFDILTHFLQGFQQMQVINGPV